MKKINNKTILIQGDKTFQPIEVDDVIYWVDASQLIDGQKFKHYEKAIAQSLPKLKRVPVISLNRYIERLADTITENEGFNLHNGAYDYSNGVEKGYNSNPNQYTLKDIKEAIELASQCSVIEDEIIFWNNTEDIIEQINSISIINVDEQFNIVSYE
jgi:hypothetical protein